MTSDIRCRACNKLLAKASKFKILQVKCSRCKTLNTFNPEDLESRSRKGKETYEQTTTEQTTL